MTLQSFMVVRGVACRIVSSLWALRLSTTSLTQPRRSTSRLGFQTNGINQTMKQTTEQVKARLEEEAERHRKSAWHGHIWRPQISEEEKAQREKQIDRGEIPF